MTGVFVTFAYDGDFDRDRVVGVAKEARKLFEGMPGLRSKVFTFDPESGEATNVYVWESEAAAREFFSPELTERVTGLYGVRPDVRFVEVGALVDNGVAAPA